MSEARASYPDALRFRDNGAELFKLALAPDHLQGIEKAVADLPHDQAGIRIYGIPQLKPFLDTSGPVGRIAVSALGTKCKPVRAILFDKTPTTNWALGWHQDRTIAVKKRVDVAGYGPWTTKDGLLHVQPPFEVLSRMVTIRAHLDPVPITNAPLLIAPGSHNLGRIAENNVPEVVKQCGIYTCLAEAGDVWLYATLILHASEAADKPTHRRVLQIDYSAEMLPAGLDWLGV